MRILLAALFFSLYSCCDCNKELSNDSLMNLGESEEVVTKHVNSVLDKFDSWKHRTYYGIDISHYQGTLAERLNRKDSLHFIICKATQGDTYIDPDFRSNWREIKENGLIRGTYHFYMFTDDPIKQADHFLSALVDLENSDIAPVVDVEEGGLSTTPDKSTMQKDLKAFLVKLETQLRRKPIIYCDPSFANTYLNDPSFSNYELWLAEYTNRDQPTVPDVWKSKGYLIWQKSESYTVYSDKSDLDEFNGRLNDLIR
ncbi:MAG: hypothetical protein CMB80_11925 [Flammeovirgaceae bacterium]|nr:hypothetical protein [Flammeovirgaceae bacterium]MBE61384.1 hypothetical protein [Flammeovirgaceae bacterium]HCX21015.1 hypothetical protein [Cytophagales bacterium]